MYIHGGSAYSGMFVAHRSMQEKFQMNLPAYPSSEQIVELPPTESSPTERAQRL